MTRNLIAAFLVSLMPAISQAQDMLVDPRLFDVSGVASNDVMNIREQPDASSPIIGEFGPFEARIEVIGVTSNGRWGSVNFEDRAGWVSMRYMAPSPVALNPPDGFTCNGNEPFWSLRFHPGGAMAADFTPMGLGNAPILMSGWSKPMQNREFGHFGFSGKGGGITLSGVVRLELCHDGMSDRSYGYSVDMMIDGAERLAISGCCNIQSH